MSKCRREPFPRALKLIIACVLAQITALLSSTGGMVSQTLSLESNVSVPFFQVGCVYFVLSLVWLYPRVWPKKGMCCPHTVSGIATTPKNNIIKNNTEVENEVVDEESDNIPKTENEKDNEKIEESDVTAEDKKLLDENDSHNIIKENLNQITIDEIEAAKKAKRDRIANMILYMICGFGDSVYNSLVVTSYKYCNAVTIVVILNLHTPASLLFTYIFSKCRDRKSFKWLWGSGAYLRPTLQQVLAVILATIGAIVFALIDAFGLPKEDNDPDDKEFTTESKLIGAAIAVIAGFLAGFVATSNEAITARVSPPELISRSGLFGFALMIIFALCFDLETLKKMSGRDYGLVAGYTVAISAAWALGVTSLSLSSGLFYVLNLLTSNLYSFFYSYFEFHQKFSPWISVGLIIVLSGIIWFCVATFKNIKKLKEKNELDKKEIIEEKENINLSNSETKSELDN